MDADGMHRSCSPNVRASAPLGQEVKVVVGHKKKQKRNKPTLSCEECVERKTKCDRSRPHCLACIKRQLTCRYSDVANLIASSAVAPGGAIRTGGRPRKQNKPVIRDEAQTPTQPSSTPGPAGAQHRSVSTPSSTASPFLLSNIPYANHTPVPFFGLGAEHPFANYWTSRGGLAEVVGVLPAREQADILVKTYFEAVDPVYPMIHRRNFYADYERFWSLPLHEKHEADPALVSLHFVVYAMGTQFIQTPSNQERAQIAEFYVSAAQQGLCLSSYLSTAKLNTLQCMVLMCYFLMNDNHASDAWSFGGILVRQAYAMGLHRDPDIIAPRCSRSDKHQRLKLWQALLFQDVFLTVLLKLPPTTTFTDIQPEFLSDDLDDYDQSGSSTNPMSISHIASMTDLYPPYELSDRRYIRSMWHMADLVSRTICMPRSLASPLTTSEAHKQQLIAEFFKLHSSFPEALTSSEDNTIRSMAEANPRQIRQNFFFRSNFWHCVMAIQADENPVQGVACNVKGALEAARLAMQSFFHFWEHLKTDASVWWVFQYRAFEEALLVARILGQQQHPISSSHSGLPPSADPLLQQAKDDVRKCLDILDIVGLVPELQKTRVEVLRNAFVAIPW